MLKMYRPSPCITDMFFILTRQCNLRCTYCYEKHKNERMSIEIARDALDFLFRNSRVDRSKEIGITLFGGEPTLEPDLCKYIVETAYDLAHKEGKRLKIGMITNCTSIPDKIIDVMRSMNGKVDFTVQLSIDGPKHIQDRYRVLPNGTGSWIFVEKTLEKWLQLHKEKVCSIHVHGCINKDTIGEVYDTYLFFRYNKGIERVWLMPIPEEDWSESDIQTYDEQIGMLYRDVIGCCKRDNNLKEVYNYAPFDRFMKLNGVRGLPCGAGTNFATVLPNGDLAACHQLGLNDETMMIGDIWTGVDDESRRIFTQYEDSDLGCGDCEHTTCYRCIASNFTREGNMFTRNPRLHCDLMRVDMKYQKMIGEFVKEMKK